jgi:hypothetical protein
MAIYLPLEMKLDGLVLKHWSKIKVGEWYLCELAGKRKRHFNKGGRKVVRIKREDYFLCEQTPGAFDKIRPKREKKA